MYIYVYMYIYIYIYIHIHIHIYIHTCPYTPYSPPCPMPSGGSCIKQWGAAPPFRVSAQGHVYLTRPAPRVC